MIADERVPLRQQMELEDGPGRAGLSVHGDGQGTLIERPPTRGAALSRGVVSHRVPWIPTVLARVGRSAGRAVQQRFEKLAYTAQRRCAATTRIRLRRVRPRAPALR